MAMNKGNMKIYNVDLSNMSSKYANKYMSQHIFTKYDKKESVVEKVIWVLAWAFIFNA